MSKRLLLAIVAALIALGASTAGCSGGPAGHDVAMAPLDTMPAEVRRAPVAVQQAYRYAIANSDILQQIPCYCGCGPMGHTSNYSCYASGLSASGAVVYDSHALGCSICVDITLDTMRLHKEGKGVPEIRAYIDSTYSPYGPSNMP